MRYSFRKDCDYNTMCKIYRNYMFENDLAATLKEKAPDSFRGSSRGRFLRP